MYKKIYNIFILIYLYILQTLLWRVPPSTVSCWKHSRHKPTLFSPRQYELQATVGDGSEMAIITPNSWRDGLIWSLLWKAKPVWRSQGAHSAVLSIVDSLKTDKEPPSPWPRLGPGAGHINFTPSPTFQKYPVTITRKSLFCRNIHTFYPSNWCRRVTISLFSNSF